MQCPSCKAKIGDTSNFCRYCGVRVFEKPAALVTGESDSFRDSSGSGVAGAAAVRARKATDITIKLKPGFYPIPKRFEIALNSGGKPEAIIGEVLRQKAEMRNLLEHIAGNGKVPPPNDASEAARKFLLSHCIICGDSVPPIEAGRTPVCQHCGSLA